MLTRETQVVRFTVVWENSHQTWKLKGTAVEIRTYSQETLQVILRGFACYSCDQLIIAHLLMLLVNKEGRKRANWRLLQNVFQDREKFVSMQMFILVIFFTI